jgi:hypothetical protein
MKVFEGGRQIFKGKDGKDEESPGALMTATASSARLGITAGKRPDSPKRELQLPSRASSLDDSGMT